MEDRGKGKRPLSRGAETRTILSLMLPPSAVVPFRRTLPFSAEEVSPIGWPPRLL